jgi:hypothetical protein
LVVVVEILVLDQVAVKLVDLAVVVAIEVITLLPTVDLEQQAKEIMEQVFKVEVHLVVVEVVQVQQVHKIPAQVVG